MGACISTRHFENNSDVDGQLKLGPVSSHARRQVELNGVDLYYKELVSTTLEMSALPPEIWAMVCKLVLSAGRREDLAQLSLACHFLRDCALPHLFRKLTLRLGTPRRPYSPNGTMNFEIETSDQEHYEDFAARCNFYISPTVAPMVQELSVLQGSPLPNLGKEERTLKLCHRLLDRIDCFVNLRRVFFFSMEMLPRHLAAIQGVPDVVLYDCTGAKGLQDSVLLQCKSFAYVDSKHYGVVSRPAVRLQCSQLVHLSLLFGRSRTSNLLDFFQHNYCPGLQSLHIDSTWGDEEVSSRILYQCPALKELLWMDRPWSFGDDDLVTSQSQTARICPSKLAYFASTRVHPMLARHALSDLTLAPWRQTYFEPLLTRELASYPGLFCNLESLGINVKGLTVNYSNMFSSIATACSRLRCFCLYDTTRPFDSLSQKECLEILCSLDLPENIEHFYLLSDRDITSSSTDLELNRDVDCNKLAMNHFAKYTKLQYVFLRILSNYPTPVNFAVCVNPARPELLWDNIPHDRWRKMVRGESHIKQISLGLSYLEPWH